MKKQSAEHFGKSMPDHRQMKLAPGSAAIGHSPFPIRRFSFHSLFAIRYSSFLSLFLSITAFVACGCSGKREPVQFAYFPPPPAKAHAVHLMSFNSLDALVPSRPSFSQILRGDQPRPFAQSPTGIAYRDGRLYVCDGGTSVVHVWDLQSGGSRRLGLGAEKLTEPVAVAVAGNGMVYVADSQRGEVVQFDAAGSFVQRLRPEARDPYRPIALAVSVNKLFVADAVTGMIDAYDLPSGGFSGPLTPKLGEEVVKPLVTGMTADEHGGLLIVDAMGGHLLLASPDGTVSKSLSQRGNRYGDIGQPKHVSVGPDGIIFVADAEFAHVHLFNQEGQLLMLLGGPDLRVGATPMPLGVAVADTFSLPDAIRDLVPPDFDAQYFLFLTNTLGEQRISLYAIGLQR